MSVEYISVYKCRQKTNSMKYSEYIKQIEIDSLWSGKRHIVWNLDRKVNILSGINGVGKSTILNKVVRGLAAGGEFPSHMLKGVRLTVEPEDARWIRYDVIRSFDRPLLNLDAVGKLNTALSDLIDDLFSQTGKKIVRTENEIRFSQIGETLTPYQLSSGEKQMLVILLTVLVEDQLPYVLFMDEPEVSLHIDWQQRLIDLILTLNPNVQIILTTHSPAVIMNGWVDHVTEVSDITD